MAGNVSLLQFGEGGGILSDAIVVLHDPMFIMSNTVEYGKKMTKPAALLHIRMTEITEDGAELDHEQFLSLGGANDFVPSADGLGLDKIGTKDAIVKTTNFAVFVQSILDAGFPPERTKDGDISWLEGIKCHVMRKAVKREGMEKREGERDATVLLVDKLYLDEKPGKAAGTTAAGAAKSAEPDAALVEEAKSILLQVVMSAEGMSIAKNRLIPAVMPLLKGNPASKKLVKLIVDDTFLGGCDGWAFDKGVIAVG